MEVSSLRSLTVPDELDGITKASASMLSGRASYLACGKSVVASPIREWVVTTCRGSRDTGGAADFVWPGSTVG